MGDSLPAHARVHGRKFRHGSAPRIVPSSPPPTPSAPFFGVAVRAGRGAPCLCGSPTIQTNGETTKTQPTGARCASAHNNNISSIFSYHIISYLIISSHSHTFAYDRIRPHTTAYDRTDFQQDKNDSFHTLGVPFVPTAAHPD